MLRSRHSHLASLASLGLASLLAVAVGCAGSETPPLEGSGDDDSTGASSSSPSDASGGPRGPRDTVSVTATDGTTSSDDVGGRTNRDDVESQGGDAGDATRVNAACSPGETKSCGDETTGACKKGTKTCENGT